MSRKYRVFVGKADNRVFATYASTKDEAMRALYQWMDALQRVRLDYGTQEEADAVGRERGKMASEWKRVIKSRAVPGAVRPLFYQNAYGSVWGA